MSANPIFTTELTEQSEIDQKNYVEYTKSPQFSS